MRKFALSVLFVAVVLPAVAGSATAQSHARGGVVKSYLGAFGGVNMATQREFLYRGVVFAPTYYSPSAAAPQFGLEYYFAAQPVRGLLFGAGARLSYTHSSFEAAFDGGTPRAATCNEIEGSANLFLGVQPARFFGVHVGLAFNLVYGSNRYCGPYGNNLADAFLRLQFDISDSFYISLRGSYGFGSTSSRHVTYVRIDGLYPAANTTPHPINLVAGFGLVF